MEDRDVKWDSDCWLTPSELRALCNDVGCDYKELGNYERKHRIVRESNAIKPSSRMTPPAVFKSSPAEQPPCDLSADEVDAIFSRLQPDPFMDAADQCLIVVKAYGINKALSKRWSDSRWRKRVSAMFDDDGNCKAFFDRTDDAARPTFDW